MSVSVTTRARIVSAARACFARDGYDRTTNKDIADAAGITTGAIYHYFDSKPELFAAVATETFELIRVEFVDALSHAEPNFVAQVSALWERAAALHERDRSLAPFAMVSPIETLRHREIPPPHRGDHAPHQALEEVVAAARARGELADDIDDGTVLDVLVAMTMGLAHFAAADEQGHHRRTSEAFRRVIDGTLVSRSASRRRAPRRHQASASS